MADYIQKRTKTDLNNTNICDSMNVQCCPRKTPMVILQVPVLFFINISMCHLAAARFNEFCDVFASAAGCFRQQLR